MTGRLSLGPIVRGHWRALSNDTMSGQPKPDLWARAALVLPTLVVFTWALLAGWTVAAPVALLTGVTLLSGGFLAVFAQLSTLRLKLTERAEETWLDVERDGIDEAVAHLLMALLLCVLSASVIIIGLNVAPSGPVLRTPWAAIVLGASTYLAILFLILIPKLYSAYVEMNHVRASLNGFHRPASRRGSRLRK